MVDAQLIAKARLLNFEVAIDEVHLFTQRHLLLFGLAKRKPQQIAQRHERSLGKPWVAAKQSGNRVQAVKKKMRMQLCTQRAQPGVGKVRFQNERTSFALAKTAVKMHRMRQANNRT